jgi:outer membrane immunogenic protein
MKRILVSAVALAGMVVAANAADIRAPAPAVKAPAYVPAPIFTWTGFYIGGNIGFGWSDGDGTLAGLPVVGRQRISGDGDGIIGGGQIGYNWQTGNFVIGFETDFQASGGEGDVRFRGPVLAGRFGNVETEWFGTIRGRLGYAMDRWLIYVTGGGAYIQNKLNWDLRPAFVGPGAVGSSSELGWAFTVGGGIEAALWQNWSVKAEYLFIGTPDSVPTIRGTRVDGEVDSHIIRLGVNYRFGNFGAGPGPF